MTASPDIGALLGGLDDHAVDYLVGGSVAALAYGAPDVQPADVDVIPSTDPDNLSRLTEALTALGAQASTETGEWQADEAGAFHWVEDGVARPPAPLDPDRPASFDHSFSTQHGRLDVVPMIAGEYRVLRPRAHRLTVAGRVAWVAHPIDVLAGMTAPRRPKDGPRVRQLRRVAASVAGASGIGFVGFRTDRFDEMVRLFGELLGLQQMHDAPGAAWFRLGADAELHVYAETDPDHAFFTTGPVVGLRVDDVDAARSRLEADGLEMLTDVERTESAAWCHFRAPDGTVLEIIGPAASV